MSAQLNLLGGFELRLDGQAAGPAARKVKALIAYLACQKGQPVARERLAGLLWPDSGETQARQSVRQALTALRRSLGALADNLEADNTQVALALESIRCDVAEFERAADSDAASSLHQAVELYRGELLEGFSARVPEFDDWLVAERERLARRARRALRAAVELPEMAVDTTRALRLARRLVRLDPLDEAAQRALMALLARAGRQDEALRQFAACRRVLADEMGIEPGAETVALFDDIRNQDIRNQNVRNQDVRNQDGRARPAVRSQARPREQLRQLVVLAAHARFAADGHTDPEQLRSRMEDWRRLAKRTWTRFGGGGFGSDAEFAWCVFGLNLTRGDELQQARRAMSAFRVAVAEAEWAFDAVGGYAIDAGHLLVHDNAAGATYDGAVLLNTRDMARTAPASEIVVTNALLAQCGWSGATLATHPDLTALQVHDETPGVEAPMVGRRIETQQIHAALAACRESGAGLTLLVRGEAGIGKSRLIDQVATDAQAAGFAVSTTRLLDFGTERAPLVGLATGLLELDRTEPATTFTDARLAAMGLQPDDLPVLLNALGIRLPPPLAHHWSQQDAAAVAQARRRAVQRLIEHGARSAPLLLVVEDIHWADETTLRTIADMAAMTANAPFVLLLSTRLEGQPLDPAWRGAIRDAAVITFDLGPLREREAEQLAHSLCDDATRIAACVTRAQGHPLILEQLLRADAGGADIPNSVQALVQARLDQLPPEHRAAAQHAAVLGHVFSLEHLTELLGRESYSADALLQQRLLKPLDDRLEFAHALIREATYAGILASQRRELHLRAANLFASTDRWRQCQHLIAAGDPAAVGLAIELGEQERRAHRLAAALDLANAGLALATDAHDIHALSLIAGTAHRVMGDAAAAQVSFERATDAASGPLETAWAKLGHAITLGDGERHQQALELIDPVYENMDGLSDRIKSDIANCRGRQLFSMGRLTKAYWSQKAANDFALAADSPLREARAAYGLGEICYARGALEDAKGHYTRVVDLCETHGFEPAMQASTQSNLGLTRAFLLEVNGGVEQLLRGEALAEALDFERAAGFSSVCASLGELLRGNFAQAITHAERGQRAAYRQGRQRYQAAAFSVVALAHALAGNRQAACDNIENCLALAELEHLPFVGPPVLAARALVSDDANERAAACQQAEAILDFAAISHCHFIYRLCATLLFLRSSQDELAAREAAALHDYAGPDAPFARLLTDAVRVNSGSLAPVAVERRARDCGFNLLLELLPGS